MTMKIQIRLTLFQGYEAHFHEADPKGPNWVNSKFEVIFEFMNCTLNPILCADISESKIIAKIAFYNDEQASGFSS